MPCRKNALESTINGFDLTNVDLIAYDDICSVSDAGVLSPSGLADNIGSFYFIPKLVQHTGVKLEVAIQLFYTGFVLLAFLSASIALSISFKSFQGKVIGIFGLALLSFIIAGIGDYYVFAGAIPMAIIPWVIYLFRNPPKNKLYLYIFYFLVGAITSLSHIIRSHSGTDVIIFILFCIIIFSKSFSFRQKTISIFFLSFSMILVSTWFNNIVEKRINYLSSIESPYELSGERIKWHNIYYSLGYLPNKYGSVVGFDNHEVSDTYSVRKALEVNPNVKLWSRDYENILKRETYKFIADHKLYFIKTLIVKTSIMVLYLILFMNIGIAIFLRYKTSLEFHLPFISGIAFNMIFGLITTPDYKYLTGLFLFSVLYSIYLIDSAIFFDFKKIRISK
jgi:hypothetical protein